MAQAGMYVPCNKMKYGIYNNISSRILGNDDLSKGQSSFEVEMIELNHILRRSDNRSLVLGDEICRGTTTIDALSLVASSITELSKRNTNFMYTTHLHKLKELECVKNIENVGIYHIKVRIENGKVIYDRTLQPGNGNTMYGIEIARAMNMDEEFIKHAYSVRDILLNQESYILSQKPSKYNKDMYMGNCEICEEKGEDTHHIGFQCMANDDGLIDYYHKNIEHNLVTLCKKCHTLIHQYKFKINGWVTTSDGKELDYVKLSGEDKIIYKKNIENKIKATKEIKTQKSDKHTKDSLRKKLSKLLEDKENGNFTSIDDYLD
jgi:DNA mismatch repair protein MutS